MPLARISNGANTEPKKKRAKTEKKVTKPTRASVAAAAATAAAAAALESLNESTSSMENDESLALANDAVPTPSTTAKSSLSNSTDSISSKLAATTTNDTDSADDKKKKSDKDKSLHNKTNDLNNTANQTLNSNLTANYTINTNYDDTMMTDVTNHSELNANQNSSEPIVSRTKCKPGFCLSVGENLANQLGLSLDITDRKKPQLIKDLPEDVVEVAAGGMHSACLTEDGTVYTFGCNDEFALGRDDDGDIEEVELPEKIIEITAGDSHTAALSETGVVYAWGTFRDGSGVLGLEQKKIAKTPMKFKLREKIVKISSGADHLVFLTNTGDVYTAGNSEHGQLGRISKYNSCRGGRRGCDMILVPGQVRIAKRKELHGMKKIDDIWTTAYCTFLKVKDSESIIAFGLNNCYQLGADDIENRYQPDLISSLKFEGKLKKVIGGMHHTLFLDTNGNVYALGSHRFGSLGLGKIEADVSKPTLIPTLKDIVDIAANTSASYAVDKYGKTYSWGSNYTKQLGQDTEDDYFVPTKVSSRHLDQRDVYAVSIGGQHALIIVSDEKDEDSDND